MNQKKSTLDRHFITPSKWKNRMWILGLISISGCIDRASPIAEGFEGNSPEVSCNDMDDDGDLATDEGTARCCNPGDDRQCGSAVGECSTGMQFCSEGYWGVCEGQERGSDEVCEDGLDNDCDGELDERICFECPPWSNFDDYQCFLNGTKIDLEEPIFDERFGSSIAIDSNRMVVGTSEIERYSFHNRDGGGIYVLEKNNVGQWEQVEAIFFPDESRFYYQRRDVAISGDHMIVGAFGKFFAPEFANENDGPNIGRVHMFERVEDDGNVRWQHVEMHMSSNSEPHDYFGFSVSILGDYIVVGSPGEDGDGTILDDGHFDPNNESPDSGAAYVFKRRTVHGQTHWEEIAYLKASNTDEGDRFGNSVSISDDYIIIGAPWEDGNGVIADDGHFDPNNNESSMSGAAYVFKKLTRPNGEESWEEIAYVKASETQEEALFGKNIDISGNSFVVGAPHQTVEKIENGRLVQHSWAGAAYIFQNALSPEENDVSWNEVAQLTASNAQIHSIFGNMVRMSGDYLVVGAHREDGNGSDPNGDGLPDPRRNFSIENWVFDAGAAYIFEKELGNGQEVSWREIIYLKPPNPERSANFGYSCDISNTTVVVGEPRRSGIYNDGEDVVRHGPGAIYIYEK